MSRMAAGSSYREKSTSTTGYPGVRGKADFQFLEREQMLEDHHLVPS